MLRRVTQSWRREVDDGTGVDWLRLEVELLLSDGVELSAWNLTARLERGGGKPFVREDIAPHGSVSIHHRFRNHVAVSGALDVIVSDEAIIIWAKLQYGFDRDPPHYFEGALAEWMTPPVPPAPPVPPVPPPPPADVPGRTLPIVAPAGEHGDLFPYTYMRCWPEPARDQIDERFLFYPYPLDGAPTGQLLQQLAALRAQGGTDAREAMQALAVSYIEDRFDADAPFLDSLDQLTGPMGSYGRIYALLAKHDQRPANEIVAEIWHLLGMSAEETRHYLQSGAHVAVVVRVWQSYLALIVELGFDRRGRTHLVQALIVEHVLGWLTSLVDAAPDHAGLVARARAVVVLPGAIFPLPPAQGSPAATRPPDASEAIVPYAIGDLLMVKHSLQGYALGELAYVESIRAGERRESTRRQFDRTIESTVHMRADASAQDSRARSSSSSLTSEVLGTLADTTVTTTYNDFGTSYGPPTTATLSGGWTAEHKPAGNPSKEDLTRFAREVLSKTVHRIAHHVAEVRSRSSQRDSEETATSVVDNAQGSSNRRALYWWLDEVHGARVVNCGNRLLIEMILQAPAAQLIERERAPGQRDCEPPLPPVALGIESFEDIGRHNFPAIVARYLVDDVEMPPRRRRVVSASLRSGEARAVELPEGYQATSASLGYALIPGPVQVAIQGVIGRQSFQITVSSAGVERLDLEGQDGAVQVVVESSATLTSLPEDTAGVLFALEIETVPTDCTMDAWRLRTFQAIQRAYAAQRHAYESTLVPDGARPEAVRPRTSARAIERKELKHGAIELLFARLQRQVGAADRPVSGHEPSDLELARPRYLQFFDAVFEWREMTYSFMTTRPVDPAVAALCARFGDGRFTEFVEAAYARLLVPVTPAHAPSLLFFLSSGALWDVPDAHVAVHPGDVALVNELFGVAHTHGEPHVVRELPSIRVPTSIAVLADGDVSLLVEGSPTSPDTVTVEFDAQGGIR